MSVDDLTGPTRHPLDDLPRLPSRRVALERWLARSGGFGTLGDLLFPGLPFEAGAPEVTWRASGLNRTGVVAQFAWPRLDARLALGLETPLAHAVTDHLLGFTRPDGEGHRQVTPVEWGILGFVFARALDRLDARPGPFGRWDLTIDRVGPDPFDPRDLGPIVTWRWPTRLGGLAGSVRLWVPESLPARLGSAAPAPLAPMPRLPALASTWRAEAGTVTLRRGVASLKLVAVLPLDRPQTAETAASPSGTITLACRDRDGRSWFAAEILPDAPSRLRLTSPLHREPTPRDPLPMPPTPDAPASPVDVPVTLVVELGRVNLTLGRLADLKPGDVVELGRHSREPVELTSNGKLVARGELVQIDAELGVRVTSVFL